MGSEEATMDTGIGMLEGMTLRDLAEELQDEKVKGYKQRLREHVAQTFCCCPGENLSHYTPLTISRKPGNKPGSEDEAMGTTRGPTTLTLTPQSLLEPQGDGDTPRVLVLVGAPGMGKTMTVRKVMVEWAEGAQHTPFDYIFCWDCTAMATSQQASLLDLMSQCCPGREVPLGQILGEQEKILFILDGFEALGFPLLGPEEGLSSDPREPRPLETTLRSLLRKILLPKSSLLVTTRPAALQSLGRCLEGEDFLEILGFSGARREEYFHRYFEDDAKATAAFGFVSSSESLHGLCVIPVLCWALCTLLGQGLEKKKTLAESSRGPTGLGVFYLSWVLRSRGRHSPQHLRPFLHNLCSLAAEGIWKHKVLFEEEEIKARGLEQPELLPLFLNEKIPKKGVEQGNLYSFAHLHLQEFFGALFYVLEDEEGAEGGSGALLKDLRVVLESYSQSREELSLLRRFLFGLLSQRSMEDMDRLGCRIAPGAREELLRWLQGRLRGLSHPGRELKVRDLDTFHFLFEMKEESLVQSTLGGFRAVELQDIKVTLCDQMALSFCIQHWAGLGSLSLRGCSFQPCSRGNSQGQEEPGSPIHLLCRALAHAGRDLRTLRFWWCRLSQSCCVELVKLLAQHPGLTQLELGDTTLGDTALSLLCQGLQQPRCHLRVLRLWYSGLTSAGCEDLVALLATSPCLEELDLSYSEGLRDPGAQVLCQGLQGQPCHLHTLRLGSCRLTGASCPALGALLLDSPQLTCLDLSDNDLGTQGVLQLCHHLQHPSCLLQTLGLSTAGLAEEALEELEALRDLKPELKIRNLLEQEVPQAGAMARLPFQRGIRPGPRGRKGLPPIPRGPIP
ncbi:NACHT, LRR and PYD domains-containing protein 3 isoform X1 [Calypte anna]|uniref:NACHT, LRR and PYD domains-containing protein 3 isoform X1 n=2 Tax=Calypte anna TaxID=9244 RepID=UPI0011C41CD6|nr:NACHT, LRR and PYD domains-containing protein 3 isoform X1 [Calypte anna]